MKVHSLGKTTLDSSKDSVDLNMIEGSLMNLMGDFSVSKPITQKKNLRIVLLGVNGLRPINQKNNLSYQ